MIKQEEIVSTITEIRRKTKVGNRADVVTSVTVFYEWTGEDRSANAFVTYDFSQDFNPESEDFTNFGELTKDQMDKWIDPLETLRWDGIISRMEAQMKDQYEPEYIDEKPEWDDNGQIKVQ